MTEEVEYALRAAENGWATGAEARVLAAEVRRLQAQRTTVLGLAHRANLDGAAVPASHLLQGLEEQP